MVSKVSSPKLCPCYSIHEIEDITNNFNSILGEGGEGKVYKGCTRTNTAVAVKSLKPEHSLELEKEIKMLSDLDHPNLVSLVGYCHGSNDEKILLYEYMCNGNLAENLYGKSSSLSWKQRLNICIGAAHGLQYLHTPTHTSRKGIIHRDVKPVNILLDENFNGKISDFGLSKMGPKDMSKSQMTTMLKGTSGYFAPEYMRYHQISRKTDVYAFGVVLTEVICRKMPWSRDESFYPTEDEKYVQWAKQNIDSDLKGTISPVCLEVFTSLLEKCLNWNPKRRPSMRNVVSMLEYALKWQEAWETHQSEGILHLPVGNDSLVLYYSSDSKQAPWTIQVRLLLRKFSVHVDERDTKNDLYVTELKQVLGSSIDIQIPHVFVRGKYLGEINEMNKFYKAGEVAKLCGVPPPRFICDRCGEARRCDDCKQTEWYVHCRKCNVLVKVKKEWKQKQRSCLECNGSQLIYGPNIDRHQGGISEYISRGANFITSLFQ